MGGPSGPGAGKDLLVTGMAVGFISLLVLGGALIVLRLRKPRGGYAGEQASLLAASV
jgi:hypothetical protein